MGVCEVPAAQLLLVGRRTTSFRSSIFGSNRLLSPYTCHQMPLHNVFKITLHLGHLNCHLKSPVMCRSKARSSRESCKVSWMIEADLAEGQLLYITGDPIALGGWKPETAILMSPTEHKNIWKTDVKVPRGTNFKYNYFIRGDKWPSCDLIWRPGPEFSVSVPLLGKQKGRIIVRDSWMSVRTERLPVHSWGSWLEETHLSAEPADSVLCKDDHGFCESPRSESLVQKSLLYELTINSEFYPPRKETKINGTKVWNSGETVSERYQPVEEPWLYQSSLFFLELKDNLALHKDSTQGKTMEDELSGKDHQSKETLEDESKTTCSKKPVSTDILINSSMCTMQRIAVLEDGKLVELLLEPVKTNVQCDSVYLGVISQLVPNMGGALVNIGTARTSLMDINQNREPFVFPPFNCTSKRKEANGSGLECKEESDAYDDQPVSHDDTEINDDFADGDFQDDRVQHMNGDFEEHETEDEFDVPDAPKRNMDGAIVDYNGTEEDGNGHHVDNETVKELLFAEVVGSHGSQPAHCVATSVKRRKKWAHVRKGTKVIVQVVKEGLGTKRPILTPYPNLRSRFWILITRCDRIGVSKKISGAERTRLRAIARNLQPPGFGLTVRTVAAGHSLEELQKDFDGLLLTWKNIVEQAKSAALAADEGVEGAIPIILHRAMGQTLSVAQDYFNEKVKSMVVDSPRTYHEITSYLQEIAPDLCDRVELYNKKVPIFSEYGIEEEIDNMLSKRVPLANGGSLVIEQTEALVSIDVNGGHGMLDQGGSSQKEAILEVNLAAAKQIARELRLRDIGGIIVVDFIDMVNDTHKRSVYEEVKKAVERDRSTVKVAELSKHGLMEITRKRVRPSVTFMISEPCSCCHATGRVEALETSFLKIENELYRLLAMTDQKADIDKPKSWPKFILRVDRLMAEYLTSGKRSRLALLSSSLKVWLVLKVARSYARGTFDLKLFTDDKENQLSNSRFRPTELGSHAPKAMLTLFPFKNRKTHRK